MEDIIKQYEEFEGQTVIAVTSEIWRGFGFIVHIEFSGGKKITLKQTQHESFNIGER